MVASLVDVKLDSEKVQRSVSVVSPPHELVSAAILVAEKPRRRGRATGNKKLLTNKLFEPNVLRNDHFYPSITEEIMISKG